MANSRVGVLDRWLPLLTPAFGLLLIVLVVLANSGSVTPELLRIIRSVPGGDKTVHFFLAGTMALLLNLSWRASHWRIGPLPIQRGSMVVALVSTLEEFSQLSVRVRSFDLEDLAYDYLGIVALGQLGVWLHTATRRAPGNRKPDVGDAP